MCAACWLIALLAGDYRHAQGGRRHNNADGPGCGIHCRGIFLSPGHGHALRDRGCLFFTAGLAGPRWSQICSVRFDSRFGMGTDVADARRISRGPKRSSPVRGVRSRHRGILACSAAAAQEPFSAAGTAALAYRDPYGYAVVSANLTGDEAQFQLVADFRGRHMHGWRWSGCSERRLRLCGATAVVARITPPIPLAGDVVIDVSNF